MNHGTISRDHLYDLWQSPHPEIRMKYMGGANAIAVNSKLVAPILHAGIVL
jgi:hypothetical protein